MGEIFPGVSCDEHIRFGRPRITGYGIETDMIASRFRAGDSVRLLARDYRVPASAIEAALRFELIPEKRRRRMVREANRA